ncbi:T9SS type A sorting domain-containing protein [uncultured Kordia sp.]|uniref:T9SS type A sorting domain-containing protein n=1 Tax=uncultured Kordia sp. TaxID=507699 RepID=UPI0026074DCB|nr:T9SS type A sorting domain-containing protein [uncultured Kordia sp.]
MKLSKFYFATLICSFLFITTISAQMTVGSMVVAQGVTAPSDWIDYNGGVGGIYVDVNTSACGFTQTPHYLVTLESTTNSGYHWYINGVPSIYSATPTGFRVYLRWADHPSDNPTIGGLNFPNPLRASTAQNRSWVIRWTAITTGDCASCNGNPLPISPDRENDSPFGKDERSSNYKKEKVVADEVSIFPNPTNTKITINSSKNIQRSEVYSLKGQLLKSSTKSVIDIKSFTPGEYIVKIYFDNNESTSKKIIKK